MMESPEGSLWGWADAPLINFTLSSFSYWRRNGTHRSVLPGGNLGQRSAQWLPSVGHTGVVMMTEETF